MFVVDTNVLVYAADRASPFHERCSVLVAGWMRHPARWYLTWGIVYEFLAVTTQPRLSRNPWKLNQAWDFIEALFESPSLGMLVPGNRHRTVAAQLFGSAPHMAGTILHDANTAILMLEHGVRRIYTRDLHFNRFAGIEPVDPTVQVK